MTAEREREAINSANQMGAQINETTAKCVLGQ